MKRHFKFLISGIGIFIFLMATLSWSSVKSGPKGDPYLKSRGSELEKFYELALKENESLRKAEETITDLNKQQFDLHGSFAAYLSASQRYYREAEELSDQIKDPELRKSMRDALLLSAKELESKTKKHKDHMLQHEKLSSEIADWYKAVKIISSLKFLNTFQIDNLPNEKPFQSHLKEQEDLLRLLADITDGYQ
ncbi:MAG: hypothetical protein H6605_06190 [Flavobacteriales bacterium]|nr:hypothetical protein [Flavobacteriales bacterium]